MDHQQEKPTEPDNTKKAEDDSEGSSSSNEMLVDEEDDEETLDEISDESHSSEIEALQKEMDMPIEDLLRLYPCCTDDQQAGPAPTDMFPLPSFLIAVKPDQNENDPNNSDDGGDIVNSSSDLKLLYEEEEGKSQSTDSGGNCNSANDNAEGVAIGSCDDEDKDDPDYRPYTLRNKAQVINIGDEYQAEIFQLAPYGDSLPYENEDRLLWNPNNGLTDEEIDNYSKAARQLRVDELRTRINLTGNTADVGSSIIRSAADAAIANIKSKPLLVASRSIASDDDGLTNFQDYRKFLYFNTCPNKVIDDEEDLYVSMQCNFNIEESLRRRRLTLVSPSHLSLWSDVECQEFEEGMMESWKDFRLIQKKVKTRSIGELVNFYYKWKKTDRYDVILDKLKSDKDTLDNQTRKIN